MLDKFYPSYYFNRFDEITPDFLAKENIKTLMIDVDNTIAPYDMPEPDERIMNWFETLNRSGVKYAFISNNTSARRIKMFNNGIGAPAFHNSKKPFAKRNIDSAMKTLGGNKATTAFVGDQIFTDVCAGKIYGMRTILVPPIKDKTNLFFRFKRSLEKPIMESYFKKQHT